MRQSKFSETQIVNILKEAEAGIPVEELSRKHGFSKSAFYKWKSKYSGMDASALKRLKELEEENCQCLQPTRHILYSLKALPEDKKRAIYLIFCHV